MLVASQFLTRVVVFGFQHDESNGTTFRGNRKDSVAAALVACLLSCRVWPRFLCFPAR